VALLSTYRKKRSFGVTAEPRGKQGRARGDTFVIQKHAATRLHYDLRLELDGVMKSWAVTRGPSLVPGEKRLAVQVEDHPIEYNSFEGTIPKGEYGGGTVLIWDRGRWAPEHDPHKGLAKGHLDFVLDGEKLHGRWHLVRMHRRPGEKRDNWLLIKSEDAFARTPKDPDILEEKAKSVVSKRTLEQIAKAEGAVWHSNRPVKENAKAIKTAAKKPAKAKSASKARAKTTKTRSKSRAALAAAEVLRDKLQRAESQGLPDFVPPQLATLHDKTPDGTGWVHEVKFDGYRMQARLDDGKVKLLTRKALDWTSKFKPVANALAELDAQSALIDGEIIVEGENGISNFSSLQDALKTGKSNFVYYVFDLLHLDGVDLTGKPLVERKAALANLLEGHDRNGIVRLSDHFEISGAEMYEHACKLDLEGLISKRRDAPYRSGRSDAWIKSKCQKGQEFVVIGYKDSTHLKGAIGALVLGYYDNGELKYAGRSGTGYSVATAQDLWQCLQPLRVDKPAFGKVPDEERGRKGIWVEPKLVVEVSFAGWTAQNHVRHAAFKGMRRDKPAREVVREAPMPTKTAKKSAKAAKPAKTAVKAKATSSGADGAVKFTHPDRIYWPDAGVTKQQLADYYTSVWDLMAPHVADRPLALVRCPDGVEGQCFFQKHAAAGLISERIRRIKDQEGEELIYIDDLDGLLTLVQAGTLEIHVWGSTVQDIEHCNRIVFDLDPGDDVPWAAVNKAARELRERLDGIKLKSFVKTTGGKGLHVVVPVQGAGWNETKDFAHAMVLAMTADSPDRYVSKMTKSIRGGKIFVDYLRNGRGATAIVAYSTRARAGAPVSVPVTWDELGPKLGPNKFTLLNIGRRRGALKKDPWADIGKVKQKLPKLA